MRANDGGRGGSSGATWPLALAIALVAGLAVAAYAYRPASDATRVPAVDARQQAKIDQLVRQLDALTAAFPGSVGVWIGDPGSAKPIYSHNADEAIVSASLYKLGVLAEAESRVDSGALHYGDLITVNAEDVTEEGSTYEAGTELALDKALEAMITVSDNGTALALWHLFGGETIDATLARAGMPDFRVTFDATGTNRATPSAIGRFFTLLAQKKLISAAASERMLARLGRQTINDRLPAELPATAVVAHKTGDLAGVTHDAGIIFTPSGPRVVVVMTRDGTAEVADSFIARVGALVFAAF